jgi:hypothetical protein
MDPKLLNEVGKAYEEIQNYLDEETHPDGTVETDAIEISVHDLSHWQATLRKVMAS